MDKEGKFGITCEGRRQTVTMEVGSLDISIKKNYRLLLHQWDYRYLPQCPLLTGLLKSHRRVLMLAVLLAPGDCLVFRYGPWLARLGAELCVGPPNSPW